MKTPHALDDLLDREFYGNALYDQPLLDELDRFILDIDTPLSHKLEALHFVNIILSDSSTELKFPDLHSLSRYITMSPHVSIHGTTFIQMHYRLMDGSEIESVDSLPDNTFATDLPFLSSVPLVYYHETFESLRDGLRMRPSISMTIGFHIPADDSKGSRVILFHNVNEFEVAVLYRRMRRILSDLRKDFA